MVYQVYSRRDVQIAFEQAGGDDWDALLRYLQALPTRDLRGRSGAEIKVMADDARELRDEAEPYPESASELWEMLAEKQGVPASGTG
ncbi:MAG: hypothetical protein GEU80_16380 [Dehalococcoidia bacterium]|nr:hypothetical protein [Dehalococcoidia bacterium]